jgi:hypothetical protein
VSCHQAASSFALIEPVKAGEGMRPSCFASVRS